MKFGNGSKAENKILVERSIVSNSSADNSKKHYVKPRGKAVALCVLLIMTSGFAHGYLDSRWTDRQAAQEKAQILLELPLNVGDWELASSSELDSTAQRILQCYGSLLRDYVNKTTGDQVKVFVVAGPRGPIAVHTPEVCYSSSGTEATGDRVSSSLLIDGESQSFWRVKFRKPRSSEPPHIEAWYAWSDGGPWTAATLPRVWLTDSLYKIQAVGPPGKPGQKTSPVEDFLQEFLPKLQAAGVGTKGSKTPTEVG